MTEQTLPIQLQAGLTIQRDGVAVNVNFLDDQQVFVSRHGYGAKLPHNCLSLDRYPREHFQNLIQTAIQQGATVFHAVGSEDLPLPQELIADADEQVLINYCPQCKAPQEDHDGVGILYCETCGYCTHVSVSYPDNVPVCDFCGQTTQRPNP